MLNGGQYALFATPYIHPPPPQTLAADVKPLLSVDSLNYQDFHPHSNRMADVVVSALASHAGGQGSGPSSVRYNLGVSGNAIDMMSGALLRYSNIVC